MRRKIEELVKQLKTKGDIKRVAAESGISAITLTNLVNGTSKLDNMKLKTAEEIVDYIDKYSELASGLWLELGGWDKSTVINAESWWLYNWPIGYQFTKTAFERVDEDSITVGDLLSAFGADHVA